jgi:hypothetical protein
MNINGCKLNSWAFKYNARWSGLELLRVQTMSPPNNPEIFQSWFLGRSITLAGGGVATAAGLGTLSKITYIFVAGLSAATSAALGGLKAFARCAGTCGALAAATSPDQLRRFRSTAGTAGSISGNSGTATMFRSLQGALSGTATGAGNLGILSYKYLSGAAEASAGALGALGILVFEYLAGTCAALTGWGEIITLEGVSGPVAAASGNLKIIRRVWGGAAIALGHATTDLKFSKSLSGMCSAAGGSTSVRMRRHLKLK